MKTMRRKPGAPRRRGDTGDADAEYRALLGVFHGGWIVPRLAQQLLGSRGFQYASGSPEVLEATRRAWAKHGNRYMAERKRRNEERPRIECKDEKPGSCECYMLEWKRESELGVFGGCCWALQTFGPPRV